MDGGNLDEEEIDDKPVVRKGERFTEWSLNVH
jgi:hypothetical protein